MRKNRILGTVACLLAFMALMLGVFVSQKMHQAPSMDIERFHGTWLNTPRDINRFEFTDTNQLPFNNSRLKQHWTLLFFGFTSCPSMCPTAMAELAKFYRLLEQKGVKQLPQVVFVTLDPKRDTLNKLKQYVVGFDPHFYGARGHEADVKAFAHEMGVAYAKVALREEQQSGYTIEHTGTVMLINPQGQLSAFFTNPHHAEALVEDYQLAIG